MVVVVVPKVQLVRELIIYDWGIYDLTSQDKALTSTSKYCYQSFQQNPRMHSN
jgi:hypothetical protein